MTVRDELALTDVSQVSTTNTAANDAAQAGAGCSCCATDAGSTSTAADGADTTAGAAATVVADYTVTGMTCGHCVSAVTEEVSALSGVVDVKVELSSGRLTVTSDSPVADELVRDAVEEAGYRLA